MVTALLNACASSFVHDIYLDAVEQLLLTSKTVRFALAKERGAIVNDNYGNTFIIYIIIIIIIYYHFIIINVLCVVCVCFVVVL